jgi:type VI secretion system protein ImpH
VADDARKPDGRVTAPAAAGSASGLAQADGAAATDALATGFFELLRQLESGGQRFGRTGTPEDEPARLGQRIRLSVATRDIAGFRPPRDGRAAEVDVEVLGLFGPEGAMPLHITRWVMERLSQRWFVGDDAATSDTTFLDFCNMLQHRHLGLFWRAWADARGDVQIERGTGGRVQAMIDALAGVGLPGLRRDAEDTALMRRHATSLAGEPHGAERLTRLLADLLGAPVSLVEFVGEWMEIPARLQTRLCAPSASLGRTATIGPRVFQRQTRAELVVGPVGLPAYRRILEDAALRTRLRHAIRFVVGREIAHDLRLVLARDEVPDPALGRAQLGRTAWLSPPRRADARDLRLYAVSADTMDAAA